jgi:hypothetical protein
MADLVELLNELPNIGDNLMLTIGDVTEIKQEMQRLTNAQDKLHKINEEIEKELGFEKFKNVAMGALPFLGTVASVFIPGGFLVDAVIAGGTGLIAEKFGNPETELTLNDLQEQIEVWIAWIDFIKEIAEDILNNSQLITQLKYDKKMPSLEGV